MPTFLTGTNRRVMPKVAYKQATCNSLLKGAYPDYAPLATKPVPNKVDPPPAPPILPASYAGKNTPPQTGELKLALHTAQWLPYKGSRLTPEGDWLGSKYGYVYKSDDKYCVSENGYDCVCKTDACLNTFGTKRCYQTCRNQVNTDDDLLFECNRVGEWLHWRIPTAELGPPGNYHVSMLTSEDKWKEFAKSNNGRKFEVYINGMWEGDFDMFGWTGGRDYVVSPEFALVTTAAMTHVDIEVKRYVFDGGNPNGPVFHALEFRTGLPTMSPLYSRPPRLQAWFPQSFDGSTWIWAIDVHGGGVWDEANSFWWSMDWGYMFPPNRAQAGTATWNANPNPTTTAPFPLSVWQTVRKSTSKTDNLRLHPMTYKLPVPKASGTYIVVLLYIDDDYPSPFTVEFGRCNDAAGTGASYSMDLGKVPNMGGMRGYKVVARDGLITMHFPLANRQYVMPSLAGIMVKEDDGKVPSFLLSGVNRLMEPFKPYAQATCDSLLKGAYPDYDASAVPPGPTFPIKRPLPAPSVEPPQNIPGVQSPIQHGELKLALHAAQWWPYQGARLNAAGEWLGSVHKITYASDDGYCVSENGYDCLCRDTTKCSNKRCYQLNKLQFNTDDDLLYECTRVGQWLHWRIPTAQLGPPGNYHVSLGMSEDKWNEFAKSNNGRKFEVWINGVWQGDFDMCGLTGGNNYVVNLEFPLTTTAAMTNVDIELKRYIFDGQNPNSPVIQMLQFRTELPNMSPLYSRPPKLQAWYPQSYDGSLWLWVIDVNGVGYWDADNGLWWSMDWGYFFPPNKAGTGTSAWRASPDDTTTAPFPVPVWATGKPPST